MEIRQFGKEHQEEYRALCKYAYIMDDFNIEENMEQGTMFGAFENGKLAAAITIFHLKVYFLGKEMEMGGIGSVATLPEYRREGHIKVLMDTCLQYMEDHKIGISTLYPFSYAYYKQYGYDLCGAYIDYKFPTKAIKLFAQKVGTMLPYESDCLDKISNLYHGYAKNYNFSEIRTKEKWKKRIEGWKKDKVDIYVWQDENDEIKGYIVYKNTSERTLQIKEMVATTLEAKKGIMWFVYNHDSQCSNVSYRATMDENIHLLVDNPRMEAHIVPGFSGRIINVKEILPAITLPKDINITFNLDVKDVFCPWNNGTFSIKIDQGKWTIERSDEQLDVQMDITTLSQLICGYISLREAYWAGKVSVSQPKLIEQLNRVFSKNANLLNIEF